MSDFGNFVSKNSSLFGGIISSLINGIISFAGQTRQFKYQTDLNEQQQQMALEQMRQSQDYNVANMATQNQYAIDAEKRAQAWIQSWNSIGAQSSRARAAGISPLAALGSSSGGVLSQSSSPSSSTPSPAGVSAGGVGSVGSLGLNLGASIFQDKQLRIEEQRVENERLIAEAQARKTNAEAFEQEFNNDILPILKTYELDAAQTQSVKNAYERLYYADGENSIAYKDAMADLDNKLKENKVKDNIIDEIKQKIKESQSREAVNYSRVALDSAQIKKIGADADLTRAEYNHLVTFYGRPGDSPLEFAVGLAKRFAVDGTEFLENIPEVLNNVKEFIKEHKTDDAAPVVEWISTLPITKQEKLIEDFIRVAEISNK